MDKLLLLTLAFLFPFLLFSQKAGNSDKIYIIPKEYSSLHHEGEQAMLIQEYQQALRIFRKVLKKYPDFPPALRSMGACYQLMGDYEKASEYYLQALERNPHFSRAMYYEIGDIHYKCGKYELAMEYFEKFDSLLRVDPKQFTYNGFEEQEIEEKYYNRLQASRRACNIAMDSIQFWNIREVYNLGSNVNTKADEYFPFLTNDGNTLFYTSRKNTGADENLFVSSRPRGEWKPGDKAGGFNSRANEGMISLVRDGRQVFFTACQREQVLGTCDIWKGKVDGTGISDLEPVTGKLNSDFWESQASISCDGSVLYFASNREGGFGGTDIWKSQQLTDGSWSDPVNLGSTINTPGDEEAPFITNDGKVLYFSSTGHVGLGEQDIFMSRLSGENFWSLPVNLGQPVNSSFRELGFFLSADGKTGYFASDRNGGQGGMDIYRFEVPQTLSSDPITYVQGVVLDSITRLPVRATVHIKGRPAIETADDGTFFLCVDAMDTLVFEIRSKDHHAYKNTFLIPEWDNFSFFHLHLLLDPLFKLPVYSGELDAEASMVSLKPVKTRELKHSVLFEFDESALKVDAIKELEQFLLDIAHEHKVRNVEVVGYADDVGDSGYNFLLSEKRAKNVGVFLKEKGIRVNKVYIEGRGEQLNDQPKWKNRKVEVVVWLDE